MADFRTCPDGHRCENGSTCKQDINNEGSYFCDCSKASSRYVGLYCEFLADVECKFPQETSDVWFCANKGVCALSTSNGSVEKGCTCPSEYEGEFCEFISGSVPETWPNGVKAQVRTKTGGGNGNNALEGVIIAAIVVIVLAVIGMLAFVVIRNRQSVNHDPSVTKEAMKSPKVDPSQALHIEADGSALRQIVQSMSSPTGSDLDFEAAHTNGIEISSQQSHNSVYEESVETPSAGGRII